jgi:hypothetical protein
MIETNLFALLSSIHAVASLTSPGGCRLYPLLIPEDSPLPAVDYAVVTGVASPTFTSRSTMRYRVEINCWAATYLEAATLRTAIMQGLDGYRDANLVVQIIGPRDLFDHDLLQYRAMVEFYVFANL